MRKRNEKTTPSETLANQNGDGDGDDDVGVGGGFFACYLLTSLSPRHKGHTYIGFTVNPKRRIRQHNGDIGCGAFRTKRKRPWEMVMCIYGFPTNVSALQFEWAWQHPKESLAVRKAAAQLKHLSGVANKIRLAYTMLTLPSWQSLDLTVNFFSSKYTTHCAKCPSLPDHMKVQVLSMADLPCYGASLNCSYAAEYDINAGDLLNHPTDNISRETDAATCNSSHDHGNDKAENGMLPQEKQLPSGISYTIERSTECIRDCSSGKRKTVETGGSSQQLPTDVNYWSILDEASTWGPYPSARQPNSFKLHEFPLSSAEVIDLMTPSPDCRARILSKKKSHPSIIDLTRSPNFVQL